MADKILLIFILMVTLFSLCGGLHLFIPLFTKHSLSQAPEISTVTTNLLLNDCPLDASMVNAIVMLTASLLTVPAIFLSSPKFRFFLTAHAYLVAISAIFTLVIGLDIWFSTLRTKANLAPVWNRQTMLVQSMLQYKFQCCGYSDASVFVQDSTCTSASVSAQLGGCAVPLSAFANKFLDIVFTTFFGFVAVDMLLLLSIFCLVKDRREKERYKLIDEKVGWGPI